MAFDTPTRNRLQRFVNDARRGLEEEFTRQLQNDYGLDPNSGAVTPLDNLRHLNDAQRETARILRDTLAHYRASENADEKTGLDRIVREQAFTVLNRLAALRMAEARGLMIESVGNGYQAKGFQLYARLAGTGLGETGDAYRVYLFSVFDELAQDLPGLFDRYSPQGRLFPREAALLQVLALINDAEIERLWAEDETIGWIYQYFNSKEERKAMRDASQAPRNSRELAVRNQFFTPRYVVEFLVDNTLGRLWFNATGGQAGLRDRCQYLLVKPDDAAQAATKLRDPRTLKLLDPACGSMHFGLYAFDLFLEIYREAWTWEQQHGPGALDVSTQPKAGLGPLCQTYADEAAFQRDVPRLIVEHNIYGVDIDPRAAQIASLALWLRAQRAWHDAGVRAKDRPRVGQGHVIAAVAPPAERDLRQQFVAGLDKRDTELFEKALQLLKGLPELGVLLQVERELPHLVRQAYGGSGTGIFAAEEEETWIEAERRLRKALNDFTYAGQADYRGRLFARDALQGLRMIDVCSIRYDVVLMNPPFGLAPDAAFSRLKECSPTVYTELYAAFVKRGLELLSKNGRLGAITSRAILYIGRLKEFRTQDVESRMDILLDLGARVMDDAFVEACAYTICPQVSTHNLVAFDGRASKTRAEITKAIRAIASVGDVKVFDVPWLRLLTVPGKKFLYYLPDNFFSLLQTKRVFEPEVGTAREGIRTFDDYRFVRLLWEVSPLSIGKGKTWEPFAKGGPYAKYYGQIHLLLNWKSDGQELCAVNFAKNGQTAQVRQASDYWRLGGCTYSKRSVKGFSARALPMQCIMASKGPAVISQSDVPDQYLLGWLNSRLITGLIELQANASEFNTGILKKLPWISPNKSRLDKIQGLAHDASIKARRMARFDETDPYFCFTVDERCNLQGQLASAFAEHERLAQDVARADVDITKEIDDLYGVDSSLLLDATTDEAEESSEEEEESSENSTPLDRKYCAFMVSGAIGIIFGRWDPKYILDPASGPAIPDPFAALPAVQPGRWVGRNALPLTDTELLDVTHDAGISHLCNFATNGILVDDASNDLDIEKQSLKVLEKIWGNNSASSEHLICSVLEVENLRSYLRSPNGFFGDHLHSYSKSRRQAPIYWPLGVRSGNYTVWVYYPNISNQTLYTAVNDFVEPKLFGVDEEVELLRKKGLSRTREEERQLEELQAFQLELMEMRDLLLKLAPVYRPSHEDGVQVAAAPLWPLFRHKPWQKILKDTWGKLEKGDYDWAQLAMNYWPERVRQKCKTDKSMAIAHGLEHLYVEPEGKPKQTRGRKKAGDVE